MKHFKEYLFLGALIIALSAYLWLKPTDRTLYTLPVPAPLDVAAITRVEIARTDGSFTLQRQEDHWLLEPGGYAADPTQVDAILSTLSGITLTALISEGANYARYELDDAHQVLVKAWAGDKQVREIAVGKPAETFRHTLVRLAQDPRIYEAQGSFRYTFDKSLEDLRDKRVWHFTKQSITALDLTVPEGRLELTRDEPAAEPSKEDQAASPSPPPAAGWHTNDGRSVAAEVVDRLLDALDDLRCSSYLADDDDPSGTERRYRLQLKGEKEYVLEIFQPREGAQNAYPARVQGNPYPFLLTGFDVDQIGDFWKEVNPAPQNKPNGEDGAGAGAQTAHP